MLGNNMFAYCGNNPVNGCDPCGTCLHRWDVWNDCERCVGKTIKEKYEVLKSDIDDMLTLSVSVGGFLSANLGVSNVTGSAEIAFDLKGNVQVFSSSSFDVSTAGSLSASAGLTGSVFAMPDTTYMAGDTEYVGGSVYVPNPASLTAIGLSGNVGRTSDGYWGVNGSIGIGTITATGIEFHAGYTNTVALSKQFNIFEWLVDCIS